ncbi:uncharacterized protein [Cicer arietinum]|uniref:uncharacterized protein n=1 Tax=Cicer arietinum TaxID=3827 RepID=UPI003CC60B4F
MYDMSFNRVMEPPWYEAYAHGTYAHCLVLILFGVTTLIIFIAIKPRNPTFDISNANLNVVYFDSPQYFNGDFTLLANFTNPNTKIDDLGVKLQKQMQSNKINYKVRGIFKVILNFGLIHFSYLLHSKCQMELPSPPSGVLVARKCITKR